MFWSGTAGVWKEFNNILIQGQQKRRNNNTEITFKMLNFLKTNCDLVILFTIHTTDTNQSPA